MHRGLKRFLYGLFYLVVLSMFVLSVYFLFLKPAPSCFDNKLNQNEEGIDCGGGCAKDCAVATLKPLETPDGVHIFPLDASRTSVLVRVINPNTTHGAKSFGYRLTLFGEGERPLTTLSGTSFLHTAEDSYLFLPVVAVSADAVMRSEFAIDAPQWERAGQFPPAQLKLTLQKTVRDAREIRVEGTVENQDRITLGSVRILALFYSSSSVLLGAGETEADLLAPAEVRAFTILRPLIANIDPQRTQVILSALR